MVKENKEDKKDKGIYFSGDGWAIYKNDPWQWVAMVKGKTGSSYLATLGDAIDHVAQCLVLNDPRIEDMQDLVKTYEQKVSEVKRLVNEGTPF